MMKKVLFMSAVFATGLVTSCQQDESPLKGDVSKETLDKIYALGFSNQNVQRVDDGYLVEGDILLHEHDLNAGYADSKFLRIAETEQYRTTELVTGTPRTITVSISSKLPASYVAALDVALARYNAEGLNLNFQRVSGTANINLTKATNGSQYLASAGFPTGGNPYNSIKVNSAAIGNQPQNTVASILAHEIGHCIGFRHTDFMSREYSCGGTPVNEGASTVGAVLIPGTPSSPDAGSFMLACIGAGMDRPFNANDKTALNYLY